MAGTYRVKHAWDHYFEEVVEQILENRPLPFLVDVGGKPTETQQELFALGTHAIILGADEHEIAEWRTIVERQGLTVIAEVYSRQSGYDAVWESGPPLVVQLTHLERGRQASDAASAAWQALVAAVTNIVEPSGVAAWDYHWQHLDTEILPFHAEEWLVQRHGRTQWEPSDLIDLLEALSYDGTIALFADYPTWIAPSLVAHKNADLLFFDARFGWLPIPTLTADPDPDKSPWLAYVVAGNGYTSLRLKLRYSHLPPHPTFYGTLPTIDTAQPVVIDGQLPRWLFTALARHYAQAGHEVAIALPRDNRAVVVNGTCFGSVIPWEPLPFA